jgi:hypothetical protein
MLCCMRKLYIILFVIISITASAQEDKINTDLPDQSDGTYVLKPLQLQVEEKLWMNHLEQHSNAWISSTLIRIGTVKNIEMRLLIEEGKSRDVFMDETAQGCSPLSLSTKWAILKKHKILPDLTFVAYLQLPFTSQNTEREMLWSPYLLMAAEKKIKKLTVSFNGGWKQNNFDPHGSWSLVSSLRYQLLKKTQVFGEYFAQYDPLIHPSHNMDMGIQYDIKKNIQIYMTTGSSIEAEEWNAFLATGLAIKIL